MDYRRLVRSLAIVTATLVAQISVAHADDAELRIGATLPLTGDLATYGNLIRDGIELAVSDLKKENVAVKVYYEDVPLPGPAALTAIRKLISEDQIQGIAGNFWNPAIPIMATEIQKHRIPTFHTAAADDLILSAGDYIVSTNTKIKDEAYRLAEHARKTLNSKTASVLFISTTFGDNYQKHFIDRFQELGGKILSVDRTNLGDSDLHAPLLKVRSTNPDVFFAAYFGNSLGIVLKQAREIGIRQQILSVYESEDPSVIATAGAAAEGLQFFVGEARDVTPAVQEFRSSFSTHFGYEPRVLGSNAYDATRILVRALTRCHSDAECTKGEMYKTSEFDGASGKLSIDAEGAAEKPFVLKTVQNGKFVRIDDPKKR